MYPSEETTARNRWQDEYDAVTREHHQAAEVWHANEPMYWQDELKVETDNGMGDVWDWE